MVEGNYLRCDKDSAECTKSIITVNGGPSTPGIGKLLPVGNPETSGNAGTGSVLVIGVNVGKSKAIGYVVTAGDSSPGRDSVN